MDDYRIHAIAFAAEQLRKVTSIMSQVNINSEAVTALDMHCKKFFRVMSLFFGAVTPTTWTIGHAVPVHTAQIFAKFGLGLGLNTMQGREAKHQTIPHYCANAMSNQHWETAFRHEFISLLWLPANDPSSYKYKQTQFL